MEFAIDNKNEFEIIADEGFLHIEKSLGYNEGGLICWTTEGENLSFEMGILLRKGIRGDEMEVLEANLLKQARELIVRNKHGNVSYFEEMSGP